MSRRQIRWMRALVHGLVAALALLALSTLPSLAENPNAAPVPASATPLLGGFQQHFFLLNRVDTPAVRTVVLPARAPLALPLAQPWHGEVNPVALVEALVRQQVAFAAAPAAPAAVPVQNVQKTRLVASLAAALFGAPAVAAADPSPTAVPVRRSPLPTSHSAPAALGSPIAAMPVDLDLTTHHSLVVESPVPLKRVSITDDAIAQAIVVSPNQVLVQGRTPGEVSLLLWDADSNARAYTVRVRLDPRPLDAALRRLFPGSGLFATASGDALVISGTLPNAAMAKRALQVAAGFSPNIINDLNVDAAGDPGQVLLQVRFAEIDRSAMAQFGADLLSTGAGKTVGAIGTGQFGQPGGVVTPSGSSNINPPGGSLVSGVNRKNPLTASATFGLSNLLNVFLFRSDANLGLTLQALEQKNLLQILAEPNLVAMDGKEASFLAGGEFPFPVVQGQGAINNVTIQFKPFGVNLHFKPTILPDGTIDLQVAPEVSSLDFSNALTISGFLIPALSTRRASTELELRDGQSFVIAGLMDNRLTQNVSKLPGLGDIPILGKFFQSHNSSKSHTELMVVVTARLVHPSSTLPKTLAMPEPFMPAEGNLPLPTAATPPAGGRP